MTQAAQSPNAGASAWRIPVSIGVVALAVLAGILLTLFLTREPEAAGGPPVSPSPSASESPAPSETAAESPAPTEDPSEEPATTEEPGPTPVVAAPDGVLPPGSVARVVVDGLRIRAEPSTDAEEVTTLARGELVVLGYSYMYPNFGPVQADGFTWYPVHSLGTTELPAPGNKPFEHTDAGWAAVGDDSNAYVELVEPRCVNDEPTLQLVQSLTEWERLACYGDRSMTLEGVLGCGGCGGLFQGTFEPGWLAHPLKYDYLSVEPQDRIGPFSLNWSPEGPARPEEPAPIIRVTGHFDDPTATECIVEPGEPPVAIDQAVAVLYCRAQFVVESVEVLGIYEGFPFG